MADCLASSLPVSTWLLESQLAGGLGETTFPLSLTPSTPYLLPVPSVMAGGTWSDPPSQTLPSFRHPPPLPPKPLTQSCLWVECGPALFLEGWLS